MGCRYRYIDLDANSTDLDANFPQSPSEPNWGLQCLRGQNTKICVKTAGPAQWPIILTKTKGTTDLVSRTLAPHEPNLNRSAEQ